MDVREKIARAIQVVNCRAEGWTEKEIAKCMASPLSEIEIAEADAVLDTLMEPDEGMIEAGVAAFTNVRDIWQAMLTHARSPTEEKKLWTWDLTTKTLGSR